MILKCKHLVIEIWSMWHAKAIVIPEIVGATGSVSKSLRQYVSNIPEMQYLLGPYSQLLPGRTEVILTTH